MSALSDLEHADTRDHDIFLLEGDSPLISCSSSFRSLILSRHLSNWHSCPYFSSMLSKISFPADSSTNCCTISSICGVLKSVLDREDQEKQPIVSFMFLNLGHLFKACMIAATGPSLALNSFELLLNILTCTWRISLTSIWEGWVIQHGSGWLMWKTSMRKVLSL